jgi:2'-5' RNA ligase
MPDKIRSFIAFEMPAKLIDRLKNLQEALRAQGLKMRWVRPENIHLTLKFLGDISSDQIEGLTGAIKSTASGQHAVALCAEGLGVFPTLKSARVLWVGLTGDSDTLNLLHKDLEHRLEDMGFERGRRSFKAHLTLAGARRKVPYQTLFSALESLKGFKTERFELNKLILFKSELKPAGPVYTPLETVPLEKA